ncbi:1-(5-phosphoribosyl)-5-[(5-phosphoribosylamino)methylideneamino] imidazole-4-carboxamide isomerase [Epibacterium sp. DP7N7-1]|jgi:phosphoribosylformimino-5-aminoimidazole carboxamide ribotide isomerase|uniref:1-(5-phosphoribosyl)-5-[(5-phosphoribosylamino)methylideneamino] imidazole-4-carboxamide isomerase n=1 Tax=Tritonibacter mobilis F1926 TaxID=1265309 RepID=A0A1B1A2H9_9RHOB|nr:1-(5-phosphoribosyl)-5-[(5-phosphoribosylamino)methylideneamino] imidazole-4-carboxamide isomerase [Tritonibacter mobilis]MBW3242379.1 1-(5-phosphoribosyl)-5-[(5-phosphoribosylamino)methylideneamino] imidazole-4-carboxamide isomerase [Epibacterium sp. DP7N7-1]PXW83020.1 1-(5-phosphoribosyl)-5-[(5-phosphoribosylamino)methylideneamino] imidazole-4-carboxamide isomerase [Ruegeria sp. P4]ANP40726.1 1-(5-phosphoribosyl)-5-((5-phosphoribosylamino)methylideneamino)imidazole-4-carboxamide isomerase [
MMIYPTMELLDGRCVTLDKGNLDAPMIWHVDPVETAKGFAEAGAEWMHLTDFNALQGDDSNQALVEDLIRTAGLPIQLGGGIRSREQAEYWIEKGVGRVVIGTMAAYDPAAVAELAKYYPDQIVLAVDVWQGQVMTEGWRKAGAWTPEAFVKAFGNAPFAGILVTDIDSDMSDLDAQLGLISALASEAHSPVIASGVVRSADDISRLKYLPNIAGALVGRALFNKTITLEEALATAQPDPEPVAEFL